MLRSTTKCTRALLSSARRASILNPQLEEVDNNLSKIIEVTDFAKEVENSQSKLVVAFYATYVKIQSDNNLLDGAHLVQSTFKTLSRQLKTQRV